MAVTGTRLTLIRHGESSAQAARLLSGHATCTGLTELGRRQAKALRDRLDETREFGTVDALYASVLPRAIETAEIISPAIGGMRPSTECDWCEIHPGAAEGLTFAELYERFPASGNLDAPFTRRLPDGESWAEFYARVGARLGRILDEHAGEHVVVVGHGGTVGASFVALGDLPIRGATRIVRATKNTSITEWHWRGDWSLIRYNDAAHLAPLRGIAEFFQRRTDTFDHPRETP